MNSKDSTLDLEKLSKILSKMQDLYYRKEEDLEALNLELANLKEIINELNSIISSKSFFTADELYSKVIKEKQDREKEKLADTYFNQDINIEKIKDTKIKRKIFSDKNNALLAALDYIDLNKITIRFYNPEELGIKETNENFIEKFLRGALIQIKESNPEVERTLQYFKNTDIIEGIEIKNAKSMDEYDLITDKIRELLTSKITD